MKIYKIANMSIRLWLDDERDPDDTFWWEKFPQLAQGGWTWVKTVPEAKSVIETGNVSFISFDNDLGVPEEGKHLASWIEEKAYYKEIPQMDWEVHSQNSVAGPLIESIMQRAKSFWER